MKWFAPSLPQFSLAGFVTILALGACRAGTPLAPDSRPLFEESVTPPVTLREHAETHAPGAPAISVDLRGIKGEIQRLWSLLDRDSDHLGASMTEFCEQPTVERLAQSQDAWRQLRRSWYRAQVGHFGELSGLRLKAQMSWWPVNEARMLDLIERDEEITREFIRDQGATVKGMNALELFLFRYEGDGEPPAIQPLNPSPGLLEERHCEYAQSLAKAMRYAASGTSANSGVGAGRQAYLNALVNQMVTVSQDVDGMLAEPLGRRSGGTPRPELIQGALSHSSVADATEMLCGIWRVWRGTGEPRCAEHPPFDYPYGPTAEPGAPTLADLVTAIQPETAAHVDDALADALAALQAIPEPFADTLARDPRTIELAFHAAKVLERTLATELSSVLGVSLTFNANDGD